MNSLLRWRYTRAPSAWAAILAICATAAIMLAPAILMAQEAKTWIYSPSGVIQGWIIKPEGSSKAYVYDRNGQRVGTVEPNLTGNGTRLVSPSGAPLLQTEPDAFGGNSAFPGDNSDPFAAPSDDN
jgi:hypothetical protein